ncbi:hypothetical protein CASFOL_030468 [Castilleja foliolosa]|uniref:Uncharacterized protein n=1 Tax=Castilleja foliolosa TaxID=1961234 RepID=A0ABD3C978_9LAMI
MGRNWAHLGWGCVMHYLSRLRSRRFMSLVRGGYAWQRLRSRRQWQWLSASVRAALRVGLRRVVRLVAPVFDAAVAADERLWFMYLETLRKWPIGVLALGINHLIRRQY